MSHSFQFTVTTIADSAVLIHTALVGALEAFGLDEEKSELTAEIFKKEMETFISNAENLQNSMRFEISSSENHVDLRLQFEDTLMTQQFGNDMNQPDIWNSVPASGRYDSATDECIITIELDQGA
jgi:hypothetical protein